MKISYEVAARGQQIYLSHLAPSEALAHIEQDNACAIAAVRDEKESGNGRTPVGVIVFDEERDGTRRVVRLFVDEQARKSGIAQRLLSFYENDDAGTHKTPSLWMVSGKALCDHGFYARAERDREKTRGIRLFSEFSKRFLAASITALSPGKAEVLAIADEDVSLLSLKGDSPRGVLAMAREPGVFRILMLEAENRRTQMRLLEAACLMMREKMDEGDLLAVDAAVPTAAVWMEKLFGRADEGDIFRLE